MSTKKGTARDDKLTGTNADDTIYGLGGNDTLDGGKGDDELLGGDGNDLLLPGRGGTDVMDGGKGSDTVRYANFSSIDDIYIVNSGKGTGRGAGGDAAGDVFMRVENVIGSNGDDNISFGMTDLKVSGFLYGGAGADTITGSWKVMRGDGGTDTIYCDSAITSEETVWLQLNKGSDFIYNFQSGQDTLRISHKEFDVGALLGQDEFVYQANNSNAVGDKAQFIYQGDTDMLYYDSDGTGGRAPVLVASFDYSDIPNLFDFEVV